MGVPIGRKGEIEVKDFKEIIAEQIAKATNIEKDKIITMEILLFHALF